MNSKHFNLIILAIVIIMAVSGCNKKTVNEVKNNDIDNRASTTGETQTENSEPKTTEEVPEIITSDINTSDWQTYRNEEYGFEVKYPENWSYKVRETGFIEFKDPGQPVYYEGSEAYLFGIYVKNYTDLDKISEFINYWQETKLKSGKIKNSEVNDYKVRQGQDFFGLSTLFVRNKNIYEFIKPSFSFEYDEIDGIYNAILFSVKLDS